ncbi:MAG TPA: hypothetical protein V6D29_25320 [Leptolyngbyaceae cyanobacterium]
MEVLEHTATRLTLQDKTVLSYWRVACLYTLGTAVVFGILAAPFTLFGLVGIHQVLTHERKVILTCVGTNAPQQTQPQIPPRTCQLVRHRLLGQSVTTIPLDTLEAAVVRSSSHTFQRGGTVAFYSVQLETQKGPVQFTQNDAKESGRQDAIASEINTFIKNPNQPLQIEQEGQGIDWIVFILFVPLSLLPILVPLLIMSVASLYLLRSAHCTLDKTSETITIEYSAIRIAGRSFFGSIRSQHALEEITAIQVDPFQGNSKYWSLVVVLKSGKRISLTWMPTPGKEEKQVMAHRIRQFLDLELSEPR